MWSRALLSILVLAAGGCGIVLGLDNFEPPEDEGSGAAGGAGGAAGAGGVAGAGGGQAGAGGVAPSWQHQWSKRFGDDAMQEAGAVAVGPGDIAIAGRFAGKLTLDSLSFSSGDGSDGFVAKLDGDGYAIWAKALFGANTERARATVYDEDANLYVAGDFLEDIEIGSEVLDSFGGRDGFVAMWGKGGGQWAAQIKGTGEQKCMGLAADRFAGGVVVVGTNTGSMHIDPLPQVTAIDAQDAYVAKFDESGVAQWAHGFGEDGEQEGTAIAVDGTAGEIVFIGALAGPMDLGIKELDSAGGKDIYVVRLTSDGDPKWGERFGDLGDDEPFALALDDNGNALIAGHFQGTVDFEGTVVKADGTGDIFVTKLSATGGHMWSKKFGNAGNDEKATAIAVTPAPRNSIVVVGHITGPFDFGGGMRSCGDGRDVFVLELSAAGEHIASECYGGGGIDQPQAVAIAEDGFVLAGWFQESLDFGGPLLVSQGDTDMFVAKFLWP